jgi:hypothetical protein
VRLTSDAVPFGHHILQIHALYFRRRARSARSFQAIDTPNFVLFVSAGERISVGPILRGENNLTVNLQEANFA